MATFQANMHCFCSSSAAPAGLEPGRPEYNPDSLEKNMPVMKFLQNKIILLLGHFRDTIKVKCAENGTKSTYSFIQEMNQNLATIYVCSWLLYVLYLSSLEVKCLVFEKAFENNVASRAAK